jgi:hypothetical protein
VSRYPVSFLSYGLLLCLLRPGYALAEPSARPTRLSVAAPSEACPSARDVIHELAQLMPDVELAPEIPSAAPDISVSDAGTTFVVRVRGQQRRFQDATRDCTERARHAAVFSVLVLDPLRVPSSTDARADPRANARGSNPIELAQDSAPKSGSVAEAGPSDSAHGAGASWDVEVGPVVQAAVQSSSKNTVIAGGLGARLRYGRSLSGTLGLAGLLPASLHFARAEARASWLPLDVGLQLSQRSSAWELSLDVGVAGALAFLEGEALQETRKATRFELGARVGGRARYWASERAGVFFGVYGSWFPEPYTLRVEGLGSVGRTPTLWLGASLGAVIQL